ncbi:MAG: hypothetical protein PWQ44_1887 [Methanolobus sp.]|nr:hypothetical protein [Methanolobus sp.]
MDNLFNDKENILTYYSFRINILFFWIKANYWITSKNLFGSKHNTYAFNSIPLGKTKITQPLKTIASVTVSNKLYPERFIIGTLCILSPKILLVALDILGINLIFNPSIEGLAFLSILIQSLLVILLLLGLFGILNCYTTTFTIYNTGGQSITNEVSFLDKKNVESFVNSLNILVSQA